MVGVMNGVREKGCGGFGLGLVCLHMPNPKHGSQREIERDSMWGEMDREMIWEWNGKKGTYPMVRVGGLQKRVGNVVVEYAPGDMLACLSPS